MPIYNVITKKWQMNKMEQINFLVDEDGYDLIYCDDEENNYGQEYDYEDEDEEEDEEDKTPKETNLKKEILNILKR